MPELPDLAVVADAFHAAFAGRPVASVVINDPIVMRATPEQAGGLVGETLGRVERRGKHLVLRFRQTDLWAAPMLSGRFALVPSGSPRPRAAVAIGLGPRAAAPPDAAAWTVGAPWIPADVAPVEIRYLDPKRMGKLYLAPAGDPAGVPGIAELGPDIDDPELTLEAWQARIRRHPGELKTLLRNQAFIAGLGNAYSDEVLWAAGLSPFRRRSSLAADEVNLLYAAAGETIAAAVAVLRERVPPTFERQVRDHLQVHLRGGQPCPRCGAAISEVGRREATSFCRACQR